MEILIVNALKFELRRKSGWTKSRVCHVIGVWNRKSQKCKMAFKRTKRESPLRTHIFKKTVKSTGLLKFLVLSDPLNPILEKNWVVTLILGAEIGFEMTCISICDICDTCNFNTISIQFQYNFNTCNFNTNSLHLFRLSRYIKRDELRIGFNDFK